MLSDSQIIEAINHADILVSPLDYKNIQPASIDLHLGTGFRMFNDQSNIGPRVIDPFGNIPSIPDMLETTSKGPLWLRPGQFVLGHTLEHIRLSRKVAGRLEGKSSLGRLGLAVHVTAGFFDPGWDGQGTLEIVNFSPYYWVLRPGMPICQMAFTYTYGEVNRAYGEAGNHYQGSQGVVESRLT